ncbi:hypothetical protein JRQ81_018001 [Phrynocephalus forsythii]|uniref:Uncharacterized protein n=1 Tax=Phrynocephalus forsythii TaxID=171643 RepID=A0A9Q0XRG1_9SAUR|nr:hypothetical protein JRQ81_018001 [Phrynocephalus forsythii]
MNSKEDGTKRRDYARRLSCGTIIGCPKTEATKQKNAWSSSIPETSRGWLRNVLFHCVDVRILIYIDFGFVTSEEGLGKGRYIFAYEQKKLPNTEPVLGIQRD